MDKQELLDIGHKAIRLKNIWEHMKSRCYNPNDKKHYKRYMGRGIKVCDEWLNSFDNFFLWALENGYESNLTIDRIDNDGNYEPSNCAWKTVSEQNQNKTYNKETFITYKNQTHNIKEWTEILGVGHNTISRRIKRGLPTEKVLKEYIGE